MGTERQTGKSYLEHARERDLRQVSREDRGVDERLLEEGPRLVEGVDVQRRHQVNLEVCDSQATVAPHAATRTMQHTEPCALHHATHCTVQHTCTMHTAALYKALYTACNVQRLDVDCRRHLWAAQRVPQLWAAALQTRTPRDVLPLLRRGVHPHHVIAAVVEVPVAAERDDLDRRDAARSTAPHAIGSVSCCASWRVPAGQQWPQWRRYRIRSGTSITASSAAGKAASLVLVSVPTSAVRSAQSDGVPAANSPFPLTHSGCQPNPTWCAT